MSTFTIEPYVGTLPLRFGMTPEAVEELLGPPIAAFTRIAFGIRIEQRQGGLKLGFTQDTHELFEATFTAGSVLLFRGQNLLRHPDPIAYLRQFDSTPYEWVGNIIFLKFGIRLTGYHDNDESQKAIGVMRRSELEPYLHDFTPFQPETSGLF